MSPPRRSPVRTGALLGLLALLAAAPAAAAHGGAFEIPLRLDGGTALVELEGAPLPVAGAPMTLKVLLPDREEVGSVRARWIAPDGAAGAPEALRPVEAGTHAAAVSFAAPGAWRLRLTVDGVEAEAAVQVHPAGDAFVAAADAMAARGVLVAGRAETLALRVTDAAGRPVPSTEGAFAHVEHLDASGARRLSERVVPLREAAPGEYAAQGVWDEPGLLRVRASGVAWRLAAEDRPPVEILVVAPEEARVYGLEGEARETPGPGALALLGAALTTARLWRRSCSRRS